jgi:hypothetical protein
MSERVIIDTKPERPTKRPDAELVIEVDLYEGGYTVTYVRHKEPPDPAHVFYGLKRPEMVAKHVKMLRELKPASVVIVTGAYSTGEEQYALLHPGVIKQIVEGKLGVDELLLISGVDPFGDF